jgi:hypothetical protein
MNKVIIITGGSRGIGAATALLAAEKSFPAGSIFKKIYCSNRNSIIFTASLAHKKLLLTFGMYVRINNTRAAEESPAGLSV